MSGSSIKATARRFERWFSEARDTLPADLRIEAQHAMLALQELTQPRAEELEPIVTPCRAYLLTFIQSYENWKRAT